MTTFDEQLRTIIETAVTSANAAFREQLLTIAGGQPKPVATTAAPRAAKVVAKKAPARTYPPHCVAKGCKQPHKGPGSSFLCEKHRAMKAKKATKK